jgi:hypothetical protein
MAVEAIAQPAPATGHLFRLARLGWYPAAALALAILVASIPGYLTQPPLSTFQDVLAYQPTPVNEFLARLNTVAALSAAVLSIGLATLLFIRRASERTGLFLAYYLLAHGVTFAGPLEMLQFMWPASSWVALYVVEPLFFGPMMVTLLGTCPDGRFAPRWSRWLVPITAVLFPVAAGSEFYGPRFMPSVPLALTLAVGLGVAAVIIGVAVYAQVFRYRRISTPVQRQQTKWVLYSLALYLPLLLLASPIVVLASDLPPGSAAPWWLIAMAPAFSISSIFLPISLTIAVMRYRLFDIDRLINRTLVYGALSGLLALVYFASVVLLQAMFPTASQVSIVVSTLAIAALFTPVRRWIQTGIDKRFYRRKYDAALILSRFSAEMREQVDLDRLALTLTATVNETLQPSDLALWLRKPDE